MVEIFDIFDLILIFDIFMQQLFTGLPVIFHLDTNNRTLIDVVSSTIKVAEYAFDASATSVAVIPFREVISVCAVLHTSAPLSRSSE